MQEIVGPNPHLETGLVGLEPLATSLVTAQGFFPFLDPVFDLGSAYKDLGHLVSKEFGTGDHQADPGEKLTPVPLDLGHHPARPVPTPLGLVVEVNDLDPDSALRQSAHRTTA
jgi:hypothetical protein